MGSTQIRGRQVKDEDITNADIADGTIRGTSANTSGTVGEIQQGTISTPDLRNAAVTALKLDSTGNFTMNTLTLSATSSQLILGTTNTTTLTFTAPASSRVYTVPDTGTSSSFIMSDGNQTINNNLTHTGIDFLANGSAAAPSLAFSNSTTTGLFRGGSSILSFATAGVEALRIDATQNLDLLQHQAKQLVVHLLSSDPSSPTEGQIWYRTDLHQWFGYNGTTNVVLG